MYVAWLLIRFLSWNWQAQRTPRPLLKRRSGAWLQIVLCRWLILYYNRTRSSLLNSPMRSSTNSTINWKKFKSNSISSVKVNAASIAPERVLLYVPCVRIDDNFIMYKEVIILSPVFVILRFNHRLVLTFRNVYATASWPSRPSMVEIKSNAEMGWRISHFRSPFFSRHIFIPL